MNEAHYNLIRRYYLGQLTPAERADLEKRLAEDEAFAREAAEYALLHELIQTEGDFHLNEELRRLGTRLLKSGAATSPSDSENRTKNTSRMTSIPRYLYAAAAVAALLIIAVPLWLMNRPDASVTATSAELYADNFSLPPAPEARGEEDIEPWRESYMAGEYEDAIAALEKITADSTYRGRSEAWLYLGLSYLAVNRPQDALNAFGQVSPDSFHFTDAQWYLALTRLKLDQPDEARNALASIARDQQHPRHKAAEQLLDRLE